MKNCLQMLLLALLTLVLMESPLLAQEPAEPPVADADSSVESDDGDAADDDDENSIKPYDEVITDEAVTVRGVFDVHRLGETYYYEIPASELNQEFLWVGRIARTIEGQGYGGQKFDTRVVRWERRAERVFLRNVSYDTVADDNLPISRAVGAANNDTILKAFDIEALGENDSVVIDVTSLFGTEVLELSARSRLRARAMDADRSFIERISSFPENVEVRAVHTYTRPPDNSPPSSSSNNNGPRGMAPGSATLEMAYSMVKLPEDPMTPRLYDDRVGYFSVTQTDYGVDEHRAPERRYITRWRLEKQDPSQQISDPVKPIEYYVDPATPEEWIPYVKQGIEDWQVAFEAAGFSNAIVARDAPTLDEDPNWSPEDARYSVVRWLPSEIPNAQGPHVHDPRTGEILESDIQFYHNVQSLLTAWYFVQAAPLDPRAQTLPLPDDLMGELLRFVVAHEVGHTLGFQHNMKSSSTYSVENVRDPDWVARMSHTPSIMDYSRFNYVAQPEDGIPVEDLIPGVGPYDIWATQWGYTPIEDIESPDDELETLNEWALQQEDTPWLRFSTAGGRGSDPGNLTEAVGDADAVQATELGMRNLERVMELLLDAATMEGDNWDELENMYGNVLGQWIRELNHVGAVVGGYDSRQIHGGQDGVRFTPLSRDRQKDAVAFLNDNAFETPQFLIQPEILRRIESAGVLSRIRNGQRSVMNFLLSSDRFTRLVEQSSLDEDAYKPTEFLADLTGGVWSELDEPEVSTDAFRRNVQRLYLDLFNDRLNSEAAEWNDMRAMLRGQLRVLEASVDASLPRVADLETRFHLEDVKDEISAILDPEIQRADRRSGSSFSFQSADPFDPYTARACWVDSVLQF